MADPAPYASPDELAVLYLRGRDARCPKCGYNRRDGVAAACPECGHTLRIVAEGRGVDERTGRTASTVSVVIACSAAVSCGILAMVLLQTRPGTREMLCAVLLLATVCVTISAMNRAVSARLPEGQRFLRQFLVLLGVASILYTISMLVLWEDMY